jgi:hypothetical protein
MKVRLFEAYTVTENFDESGKRVAIHWHVWRDEPLELPYNELIEAGDDDYTDFFDPRDAINELFTADEAQAFKAYFEGIHAPERVIVEPACLPILCAVTMPISAIPLGGPQDVMMIWKRDGYPLRFKVGGYFDLRHAVTPRKRRR